MSIQELRSVTPGADAIEHIKRLQKNGLSEDIAKDAETNIQNITDKFITTVDKHLVSKEKRNNVGVDHVP